MTSPAATFQANVDCNEYLPEGGRVVDAVVTVTATGPAGVTGPTSRAAEVIMVDCSASMTGSRLAEAKRATVAAIDTLRDGVEFAVVAGSTLGEMAYPQHRALVPASAHSRDEAKRAVHRLHAAGGTAMGTWLDLANHLFAGSAAEIKHAILLTDGRNQHETTEQLRHVLAMCEGRFTCDSRGVGGNWVATELRMIAATLLGTADGLADPAELAVDFQAMTEAAMGKAVAAVSLRVWAPAGAQVKFVKQVFPQVLDLTGRRTEISPRIGDYPTGAWGAESRDYHICIEVPAGAVGEEMLAARVSVVSGEETLGQGLVLARWTDDTVLSTKLNPQVAHYTGQAELADAIQEGMAAREAGDVEVATAKLGRAVKLATESGHSDTAKLLAKVVDVVDVETGTVRLKKKVAEIDAEIANVRSVKTIRVKKAE